MFSLTIVTRLNKEHLQMELLPVKEMYMYVVYQRLNEYLMDTA